MFLSNASVRRPIAMSCLVIALGLLGIMAYPKLGLEMAPKMELPIITLLTIYPGASPEELEIDVAKRIEDQVVTLEGLKHVTSSCSENMVVTLLQFNTGVDVDIAAMDTREKLDLILNDFPENVEDPMIMKFDVNATPVLTMALTGTAPIDEMYDYAANDLNDRITIIQGVAETQIIGGAEREVHVLLDREALAARGLSSMNVVQSIAQGIGIIPSGRVKGSTKEYAVKYDADFKNISDIGYIETANEDGQRSYIKDIARIQMSTKELRQKSFINGEPCIAIKVVKKADANAVEVIKSVREAMAGINSTIPGGMKLVWVRDDEVFTQALVDSAWTNIIQGIILTALILFFFLYNLRTTIIVIITMPLTIIIGFYFMQFFGYSLNSTTLMAIGMSVGLLVTNSIVVIEAIIKWLERTGKVKDSAQMGASEAAVAVFASAGTNIVVLFPIAMMQNMVGLFIKPLALTMVIMTLVSFFISFTLTPILASVLLKPSSASNPNAILNRMGRAWDRFFDRIIAAYGSMLEFNRRNRIVAALFVCGVIALFVFTMPQAGKLGMGFVPTMDRAEITVKLEFPSGYNLSVTESRVKKAEALLKDTPQLKNVLSMIGKVEGVAGQNTEGVYLAQILLVFPSRIEREETIYDLIEEVKTRLQDITDCIITVSIPSAVGGQSYDIELEIYGDDLDKLDELALRTSALAQKMHGIRDIDTTVREGKPEIRITPKRAVMADLGFAPIGLGMVARGNLEGITAGTYKKGDRNFDIVVKYNEEKGKDQIGEFQLPAAPGHPMLISTVADVKESLSPIQIVRKDKQRIAKIVGNLESDTPLGVATGRITSAINEQNLLPPGYEHKFGAGYEMMNEGQRGLAEAGLVAIILIVLTLAAILESFKQPLIVLLTIPLSLIGVIWGLSIFGYSFSILVTMAIVMMSGIVVNNAILIMDQFNINVKNGIPLQRAMINAAKERFRPVTMITLAAVLGMAPLAFGKGIGCEMRNDIGVAMIGGIFVSGVLSVFIVPILYNLFAKTDRKEPEKETKVSGSNDGEVIE
ncbi:MAG TPA: efflux RND transporter permease subunit [bacterium]|mgnify:CR=1 FL=1|nr:efflux RND transporter permease subunit [bacterium]